MEELQPIKNKEEKTVAIAVMYSMEFVGAFDKQLREDPNLPIGVFYSNFSKYFDKEKLVIST